MGIHQRKIIKIPDCTFDFRLTIKYWHDATVKMGKEMYIVAAGEEFYYKWTDIKADFYQTSCMGETSSKTSSPSNYPHEKKRKKKQKTKNSLQNKCEGKLQGWAKKQPANIRKKKKERKKKGTQLLHFILPTRSAVVL